MSFVPCGFAGDSPALRVVRGSRFFDADPVIRNELSVRR
jgi:hypothetical protein